MYTFITVLLLTTSLACMNTEENKTAVVKSSSSVAVSEIETPIFKMYGEFAPTNYLNGGEDDITLDYGFLVERVAGCEITMELVESVKENNRISNEQMIASYGEGWKANFEEKTGVKFGFPID